LLVVENYKYNYFEYVGLWWYVVLVAVCHNSCDTHEAQITTGH